MTWIEQLGCKKQALGASRTIAVSASPFSADAAAAARHYGIDLRLLSEITDPDIHSWFLPTGVVHVFKECELLEAPDVTYEADEVDRKASPAEAPAAATGSAGTDSKVFVTADGRELSLNDIWRAADEQSKLFDAVPSDDAVHVRRLAIKPADSLLLKTALGLRRVHEIRLVLALRWKHERINLSDAKVVTYGPVEPTSASPTYVRVEFETKESRSANIRFGAQMEAGSHLAQLSMQLLSGKQ